MKRCRAANVVPEQLRQPIDERRVAPRLEIRGRQLVDWRHQRLGHEPAAELAEVSAFVGIAPAEHRPDRYLRLQSHRASCMAVPTAPKNAARLAGFLMPGLASTPDETSIAQGRTC